MYHIDKCAIHAECFTLENQNNGFKDHKHITNLQPEPRAYMTTWWFEEKHDNKEPRVQ